MLMMENILNTYIDRVSFRGGGGGGRAFSPLGSLSPPLGTGSFLNDNSSLMYG